MDEFVSVLDLTESGDMFAAKRIRDEVADIQYAVRRAMDRGLSLEEMRAAEKVRDAANAASEILNEIL